MRDAPLSQTRPLTLRFRVGIIGSLLTLGVISLGYLVSIGHFSTTQLPWTVAAATCGLASLLWFRASGTLDCVESELLRTASQSRSWKDARKIVDANSVATAWNSLLDQAAAGGEPKEPVRTTAALDDEVITLARAMRELPSAWLITDGDCVIKNAGTSAAALFAVSDRRALINKDLMELIELREPAQASPQLSQVSRCARWHL